ncbi:MAG: NAD-dependent epimerase/dehydratase family protein [Actinomycetota bacterium]
MHISKQRSPTRIIVTGGAGFIGSHIADRLAALGHEIVAVDDLSSGREANLADAMGSSSVHLEKIDVRTSSFRSLVGRIRPDVIVHMAAQIDVRHSVSDPMEDADRNIIGTLSVYEAARASGAKTVLIASSGGTIYGEAKRLPTPEGARTRPIVPYGISKRVLGDYADFYERTHGIRSVLLALGNVYGPRQDPHGEAGVVAIFLGRMLRGEQPVIYGDGTQVRDYVYVGDVVQAFLRALRSDFSGTVNIGTGIGTSVLELFRACGRAARYAGEPRFDAPRTGELQVNVLDVGLAERVLGWKPKTSLATGLRRTLSSLS